MTARGKRQSVIAFSGREEWEDWLEKNHAISEGVWIRFHKKGTGKASFDYAQALDGALCYGWIDSQAKGIDDEAYIQRFSPRKSGSPWSKRNREHVDRLTREGRMKPAGLREVEDAKADGRWDRAYDSPATMEIPEDFLEELSRNEKAEAFFKTLNKANTYAIAYRLQTAKKPETRKNRMRMILEMLSRGEKFH